MNIRQSTLTMGLLMVVATGTLSFAPAVGASIDPVAHVASELTASTKGSNPNSHFCHLIKEEATQEASKLETAATQALEKQDWKVAQKDLKTLYKKAAKVVGEITTALSSAPAKVRAASKQGLKLLPAEVKAVNNSTSVNQFESAEEAATSTQAFKSVAQVLSGYETAQCGAVSPTT